MNTTPVLLVQAPFTQLNSPYPAVYYLKSFLGGRGRPARAVDAAIRAFHRIYSRAGLEKIFRDGEAALALKKTSAADKATADNLLRYLSNARAYADCIEGVTGFLSGKAPDFSQLLSDPDRLPNGYRVERYLEETQEAPEPAVLASLVVEDLADFISYALDPGFSLVRYAESKAASQPRFSEIGKALEESYVIQEFVRPLAADILYDFPSGLVCVSAPFPGCLAPAIAILQQAKKRGLHTALGGGYVSTELRQIRNSGLFDAVDYLCFDGGYGALASILDSLDGKSGEGTALFRVMRREGKSIRVEGFPSEDEKDYPEGGPWAWRPRPEPDPYAAEESAALSGAYPDFGDIDPGDYLRMQDSGNPMHALWSNGIWLKCRLAYGCYWGKCAFCDGSLDYIKRYRPCDAKELHAHMLIQARAKGLCGIHFVDEAAPVPLLLSFARENARAGRPLSFWGNTRFEPLFTRDRAEFLSWSGFLAASAGIEVAGEAGLSLSAKGLSMADIVSSCDNLSRAGILVHAYLMHGLPRQSEEDLVDSLEILKQMFRLGLLHSAFWHPFVLTRHSPLYGKLAAAGKAIVPEGDFALNDLDWRGSGALSRYAPGLESALSSYMEGEAWEAPASTWFDFKVPEPRVEKDYVKTLRGDARKAQAKAPLPQSAAAVWIGGRPIAEKGAKGTSAIRWSYRNELKEISVGTADAPAILDLLRQADAVSGSPPPAAGFLSALKALDGPEGQLEAGLHRNGLLYV